MTWERIPTEVWRTQTGHVDRYRLAARYIIDGDHVLDAACGIAYGATVLHEEGLDVIYTGLDRPDTPTLDLPPKAVVRHADLNTWRAEETFDVALCFETLEHIENPGHLANALTDATRDLIVVSVPTVPTRHSNPWHLHDFDVDDIPRLFPSCALLDVIPQPEELSHIYLLRPITP